MMRYNEQGLELMDPYIMGSETEYGVQVYGDDKDEAATVEVLKQSLHSSIPRQYNGGKGQFLRNGAKLYMDIGSHPEYATQEAITVKDVLINELAGEQITEETLLRQLALSKVEEWDSLRINKRVTDFSGNSWGYHENYSYGVKVDQLKLFGAVALHVATRGIFTGCGGVDPSGRITVAQKTRNVAVDIGTGTTGTLKPLIVNRDEPHADAAIWQRLNVVGGDPNMSPWATMMKFGTTVLVMELVRQGYNFDHLTPYYGANSLARQTAMDTDLGRSRQPGASNKAITALDVQWEFFKAAKELSEMMDFGEELNWVLEEWGKTLTALETDPPEVD